MVCLLDLFSFFTIVAEILRRECEETETSSLLLISPPLPFLHVCFSSIFHPSISVKPLSYELSKKLKNGATCSAPTWLSLFVFLFLYLPLSALFSFRYNCLILPLIYSSLYNHRGGQWRLYKPSIPTDLYSKQLRRSALSAKFIHCLSFVRFLQQQHVMFQEFLSINTLSILRW